MKHSGGRRVVEVILLSGILVICVLSAELLSTSPTQNCTLEYSTAPYKTHPAKLVVRPWLGQHQVFGIFKIPLRYRSGRTYSGTLTVQSFTSEFLPDSQPQTQLIEDVVAEPGYYLVRGYVPTRIALWFLMTGRSSQLRSPCEWTLELIKRSP